MAGALQTIFNISAQLGRESLFKDVNKGIADSYKAGRLVGNSFEKGFNEGTKTPMGSVGSISSAQHQLLQNAVQKRLKSNLEQIDNITDKALINSLSAGKLNRMNTSLSRLAQVSALNNFSMTDMIQNPNAMTNIMGRSATLDVLRVLDRNSFKGYDTLLNNSVKEMRDISKQSIINKANSPFNNPKGYKPSIATLGGIQAGNPVLNRSAAYGLGTFFGSPSGMAIGMGAFGAYTANQGIQTLANYDTMYRQTSAYMGGENPLDTFNSLLRDPLEDAAHQYGLSITELNNYVMEAIKSGFDPKNIASSLDSVAGLKRTYALSVPAITELIVMASNQGWIDPSDSGSINKHIAKLITMVSKTKGSLGDYSGTLSYAQTLLSAPGMTDTDYITLMGIMSNSNIKGTRGGRSMAHFFQRLLVPDSSADKVQDSIINAFKEDGINVTGNDMNKLSDYFGSLGWSMYNKKGEVNIGEGKKYSNYTEAIVDLMAIIDTSKKSGNMSDSDFQKFGGEFGQIAQRVFAYLAANYGDLTALRSDLVATESNSENIINASQRNSTTGIGFARDQFKSGMEELALSALKLEESFGALESSLEGLIWLMKKISGGMSFFSDAHSENENSKDYTKTLSAVTMAAADLGIDLNKPMTDEQDILLKTKSQEYLKNSSKKPWGFKQALIGASSLANPQITSFGLGIMRNFTENKNGDARSFVESWAASDPEALSSTMDHINRMDSMRTIIAPQNMMGSLTNAAPYMSTNMSTSFQGTNSQYFTKPITPYSDYLGKPNQVYDAFNPTNNTTNVVIEVSDRTQAGVKVENSTPANTIIQG